METARIAVNSLPLADEEDIREPDSGPLRRRGALPGAGALVLEDQPDLSVIAPRATERSPVPSTRLRRI